MYSVFALGIGVVITAMNGINSGLAQGLGSVPAVIVIHLAGLATVSLVILLRRDARNGERPPLYLYGGGAIGVMTVFSSAYAFPRIGASMTVALALIGQTAVALVVDSTGLLGMKKYPFAPLRLLGLGLAAAGLALMVGQWRLDAASFAMAFVSGVCPAASSLLNSRLGSRIGLWRGVRANYVVGLAAAAPIALAFGPPLRPLGEALAGTSPILLVGGGTLGVAVVWSICFLLPRMPMLRSTLAMFSGQVIAGLAAEAIAGSAVPARKIAGAIVLLAGLAVSSAMRERAPSRAG